MRAPLDFPGLFDKGFMASLVPTGSRCQHIGAAGTCWAAAVIRTQLGFKLGADKGKINCAFALQIAGVVSDVPIFPPPAVPLQSLVGGFNPSLPQRQTWVCPDPCVGRGCQDPEGQKGGFWPLREPPYPSDFRKNHPREAVKEWVGSVCLISIFNNIKAPPAVQDGICPRSGLAAAGTVV